MPSTSLCAILINYSLSDFPRVVVMIISFILVRVLLISRKDGLNFEPVSQQVFFKHAHSSNSDGEDQKIRKSKTWKDVFKSHLESFNPLFRLPLELATALSYTACLMLIGKHHSYPSSSPWPNKNLFGQNNLISYNFYI